MIFAVKFRQALIMSNWENELFKYITAIVRNNGHKLLQINGMPDHVHMLIGMRPSQSLSELIKLVKMQSSFWINQNKKCNSKFQWQSGFGAFALSSSDIETVITYIANQKIRHRNHTFLNEYLEFLTKEKITFDPKFIFESTL